MDSDSDATYCSDVENRTPACSTKRLRKKPDYFKSQSTHPNIEKLQETVNHIIGQNPERELMAVLLNEAKKKKAGNLRDQQILSEVTQKLNNFFIGTQEISSGQEPMNILKKADLTELTPRCAPHSNDSKASQQALTHHIPTNDRGVKKVIRSKTTVLKNTNSKVDASLCGKSEQIVATTEISDSMEKMDIAECDQHTKSSQIQIPMNIKKKRIIKPYDKSQTKIKTFDNLIDHDHCYSQTTDSITAAKSTEIPKLKISNVEQPVTFTDSQIIGIKTKLRCPSKPGPNSSSSVTKVIKQTNQLKVPNSYSNLLTETESTETIELKSSSMDKEQIVPTMEISDSMEKMDIAECDQHTQSSQMQTPMNIKKKRIKKPHDKSQTKINTFYNLIDHDHCYSQTTDSNTAAKNIEIPKLKISNVEKQPVTFTDSQIIGIKTRLRCSSKPGPSSSSSVTKVIKQTNQSKVPRSYSDLLTETENTETMELKSSPVDKESAIFTNFQTESEYSLVPGCSRSAAEAAKPIHQSKGAKNKKRKCEQLSCNKSQTKISDYYMQENSNIQTPETIKMNDKNAPAEDIKRSEDFKVENGIKEQNIFDSLPSMEVIEQELQEAAEIMTKVMDDFLASIKNLKQDILEKRALQAAAAAETNECKYPVEDSKYKKKEGLPNSLPIQSQFTITKEEELPNLAFCNETVTYYRNNYKIPDLSDFEENI